MAHTLTIGDRVSFPAEPWTGWQRLTGVVKVSEPDARGFVGIRHDGAAFNLCWHDPAELVQDGDPVLAHRDG